MSRVRYDAGSMTVTIDRMDDAARALGRLKRKTPAAAKVSINAAARLARKRMLARAEARYALNAAGKRALRRLAQKKKATNTSLLAELRVKSLQRDMGYFTTNPPYPAHYPGVAWARGPKVWTGKVLKSSGMKRLDGDRSHSKAFMVKFKSGHIGMVQRLLGTSSGSTTTERGFQRWRTRDKRVEQLQTVDAPSETAMHGKIWPQAEPEVSEFLRARLDEQVQRVLEREGRRKR